MEHETLEQEVIRLRAEIERLQQHLERARCDWDCDGCHTGCEEDPCGACIDEGGDDTDPVDELTDEEVDVAFNDLVSNAWGRT